MTTIFFNQHPNSSGYTFSGSQRHVSEIESGTYSCEGYYYDGITLTRNIYFPVLDFGFINSSKDVQIVQGNLEGDTNFNTLNTTKGLGYVLTNNESTTLYDKSDGSGSFLTYDKKYIDGGRIVDGPRQTP